MKVPLAPFPAAVTVKVTVTPGKALPLLSLTVACKVANAVLTGTLCVPPPVTAMVAGAVPVPLSGMEKELGLPESLMTSVPVRVPVADGLKITLTVQLDPAERARPFVHEFVPSRKSPVTEGVAEILIEALVPFVSVTGCGVLWVLTSCSVEKVTEVGFTKTTVATPVPESATVGEPLLVWMVAVSGLAPTSCGVNLIYRTHDPVFAMRCVDVVQAFVVWVVSTLYELVPKVAMGFENVTAALVELTTSTLCVTDEPTLMLPKPRLEGDAVTLPAGALPSRVTV